jgi:hypothetical protein
MGEVSKLAGGDQPKGLAGRELGEFDSVKKVSMLIDDVEEERRRQKGESSRKY